MKRGWDIRTVYYYLVSFVTLMMIITGTVQVINRVVDVMYPPSVARPMPMPLPPGKPLPPGQDEAAYLEQMRIQQEQMALEQRRYQVISLINSFALIMVATPTYLYHWRRIKALEAQEPRDT